MSMPGDYVREGAISPARPAATPAGVEPIALSSTESAVSWAAILAGAAASAALGLILVLLGVGLGLSAVSPWAFQGVSAETLGWSTIVWICFTSIVASGMGGYLAGRLRIKWTTAHTDEVYFRDTAHGFLAWAVGALFTAAVLTSAIGAVLDTGARAGTVAARGAGTAASAIGGAMSDASRQEDQTQGTVDYFVDRMLRGSMIASDDAGRGESQRIFTGSLRWGDTLNSEDQQYLANLVAERTGLSPQEAQLRVSQTHQRLQAALQDMETRAREAADAARKAAAHAALWLFISMLMGAFSSSLMATWGGRQRDS